MCTHANVWQYTWLLCLSISGVVLIAKGECMLIVIIATIAAIVLDVWAFYEYKKIKEELQKEYYDGKDA